MAYYDTWVDPGLAVSDVWTDMTAFVKQCIENCQWNMGVASAALEIPRRLGSDATGEQLRADKYRMRRIRHHSRQALKTWCALLPGMNYESAEEVEISEEMRIIGAQVNIQEWADSKICLLRDDRRVWCTAMTNEQYDPKIIKKGAYALTVEMEGFELPQKKTPEA